MKSREPLIPESIASLILLKCSLLRASSLSVSQGTSTWAKAALIAAATFSPCSPAGTYLLKQYLFIRKLPGTTRWCITGATASQIGLLLLLSPSSSCLCWAPGDCENRKKQNEQECAKKCQPYRPSPTLAIHLIPKKPLDNHDLC